MYLVPLSNLRIAFRRFLQRLFESCSVGEIYVEEELRILGTGNRERPLGANKSIAQGHCARLELSYF